MTYINKESRHALEDLMELFMSFFRFSLSLERLQILSIHMCHGYSEISDIHGSC